jgi:hypothetical protein
MKYIERKLSFVLPINNNLAHLPGGRFLFKYDRGGYPSQEFREMPLWIPAPYGREPGRPYNQAVIIKSGEFKGNSAIPAGSYPGLLTETGGTDRTGHFRRRLGTARP